MTLHQPIEIVLSDKCIFHFSEDLQKECRGSLRNINNEERIDTESSNLSNEINLLLPQKLNRTSSVDYVVIDDPCDPKKSQI